MPPIPLGQHLEVEILNKFFLYCGLYSYNSKVGLTGIRTPS
jgi:hypothetical protein